MLLSVTKGCGLSLVSGYSAGYNSCIFAIIAGLNCLYSRALFSFQ